MIRVFRLVRIPLLALCPVWASGLWSSSALAADGDQSAEAEALFRSGRELMGAGNFAEACPKFAESNRIDPKLGTLMNLALCHEKAGRTASAWAEYVEAADIAKRVGQAPREQVARERVTALEVEVPRVIISAAASEVAVTLDDKPIRPGAFGVPFPVDPGNHVVQATAPGKTPFTESFAVGPRSAPHAVHVPLLGPDDSAPASPVRADAAPVDESRPAPSNRRTWAWVAGGTGVAIVGAGAFFGLKAFSEKSTAQSECSATMCTAAGSDATSSLKTFETLSTISTLVGIAAVGVGVYLFVSSSAAAASPAAQLRVRPDFGGRRVLAELVW